VRCRFENAATRDRHVERRCNPETGIYQGECGARRVRAGRADSRRVASRSAPRVFVIGDLCGERRCAFRRRRPFRSGDSEGPGARRSVFQATSARGKTWFALWTRIAPRHSSNITSVGHRARTRNRVARTLASKRESIKTRNRERNATQLAVMTTRVLRPRGNSRSSRECNSTRFLASRCSRRSSPSLRARSVMSDQRGIQDSIGAAVTTFPTSFARAEQRAI